VVEQDPPAKNEENPASETPSAAVNARNPNPEASKKCEYQRQRKERDWYDCVTLLIAVLGLIGVWYYAYWSKVQSISTRDAAKAARDTARAAVEANRPWVGPEGQTIDSLRVGEIPKVILVLKNFGRSPALNTVCNAIGAVIPKGARYRMTRKKIMALLRGYTPYTYGTLWPDQRFGEQLIKTTPITNDQMKSINDGTAFYVVGGVITYKDTSFKTTHHTWIFLIYAADFQRLTVYDTEYLPPDD